MGASRNCLGQASASQTTGLHFKGSIHSMNDISMGQVLERQQEVRSKVDLPHGDKRRQGGPQTPQKPALTHSRAPPRPAGSARRTPVAADA